MSTKEGAGSVIACGAENEREPGLDEDEPEVANATASAMPAEYNPDDYDFYDQEPTDAEKLAAAIAHAATLDTKVASCGGCNQTTDAWVVRNGMNGDGLCRACAANRATENAFAKSAMATLREGVKRLLHLRQERDKKISEELAKVPF